MFDQLTQLVAESSAWAYVVVLLFAVVDAVLPVAPSETAVITAGVVAVSGDLSLPVVIAAAAVGAFAGDNLAYGIGRRYGTRVTDRFFRGEKAKRRLDWASTKLEERGGELIAVARFIPGGRTAVTLTAGLTRFPWRRFAVFDAIAALIWAGYAALLGYFGGQAFEHQPWKGLLVALGIAFAVTLGTELVRWLLRRRRRT
jgi:membrane protein DedA with SNARE-associated domain